MRMRTLVRWVSVAGFAAAFYVVGSPYQAFAADDEPALTAGKAEFRTNCGSCHGLSGKGDGPIVPLLKEKPADLTGISKRNGGEFPFWETYRMIDGREPMDGHGGREMPIWGDRFSERSTSQQGADAVVRGRILELIVYLQSIQED